MYELIEQTIQCPYCGEMIELTIDCSEQQQRYIEDCHVCCQPININVEIDVDHQIAICVTHDNE